MCVYDRAVFSLCVKNENKFAFTFDITEARTMTSKSFELKEKRERNAAKAASKQRLPSQSCSSLSILVNYSWRASHTLGMLFSLKFYAFRAVLLPRQLHFLVPSTENYFHDISYTLPLNACLERVAFFCITFIFLLRSFTFRLVSIIFGQLRMEYKVISNMWIELMTKIFLVTVFVSILTCTLFIFTPNESSTKTSV